MLLTGNMQALSSGQDLKLAAHLQLSTAFNGHALTAPWIIGACVQLYE